MNNKDFTTSILVDQSPKEAFDAINNVIGWWTENLDGGTHNLNDEFEVRFGDVHYSKQKLTEVIPGEKVVWLITDSKLTFVKDQTEWTGTKIIFDITRKGNQTEVRFTQQGLTPAFECYGGCSNAWTDYVQNSLYSLITTGTGKPSLKVS
ncbi:SRPBCC family protein [Mucilaginibacter sp. UYCu711]|uniref:SRPBCC family protein n=1 Tax=Mucilaginibacter sp. UYCu711 TaxID=3156339 RepID=UPI003D1D74C4